ncbi:MAG: aldehyde ferredoxin oxidoreductase N-terminal domain-containing protein [bacterium]
MKKNLSGYYETLLEISLTERKIEKKRIPAEDLEHFIGGRGLGLKILWDRIKKKPGLDPLSPENPLIFMSGPFSGFPIPSASRLVVVTKSPCTSPVRASYPLPQPSAIQIWGDFSGLKSGLPAMMGP